MRILSHLVALSLVFHLNEEIKHILNEDPDNQDTRNWLSLEIADAQKDNNGDQSQNRVRAIIITRVVDILILIKKRCPNSYDLIYVSVFNYST